MEAVTAMARGWEDTPMFLLEACFCSRRQRPLSNLPTSEPHIEHVRSNLAPQGNAGARQKGTLAAVTRNKAGPEQPVLVLDMSSLRFRWNPDRTAIAALTPRGEALSVVSADPSEPLSAVAFRAMDAALGTATVLRTDASAADGHVRFKVGFYNPFTGEVAYGSVPDTVAFTSGGRLTLPESGGHGVVSGTGDAIVLSVNGQVLTRTVTDRARADRLAASVSA